MGWLWKNHDSGYISSSSGDVSSGGNDNSERCATRKVVRSQCRTEEVEPGKFVRRPSEMVESNEEYTEEDVTDEMVKGSFPFGSAEPGSSYFPGLRSDIEAIEHNFFSGINRFFEAAEEMKNDFFNSVGVPHIFDKESPSSHKHGIHIEGAPPQETLPKHKPDGDVDLSGLARDI